MRNPRDEIRAAAVNTWSQIAADWFEGWRDSEEEITDAHIAEAIFDADRITTFNELSPEALEYLEKMVWPVDMIEIVEGIA